MNPFKKTGRGEWVYLGFRIRRHKGSRFTFRTQVYPHNTPHTTQSVLIIPMDLSAR